MESGTNITSWECVANTLWGSYITEIEKTTLLKANALAGNPTTCLEIGCEGGRWSKLLSDLGWSLTCTDVNPETLKICKERIAKAECILVKPEETTIPLESNSVGLLLCLEVFPVMHSQWFLAEAFRVLQTNGIVVGVFLNLLSLRGLWAHINGRLRNSYQFYKLVYPRWRNEARRKGLRFLYEEGFCWFCFRRDSNSGLVPFVTQLEKSMGLRTMVALSPWVVFIAKKEMIAKNEEGQETANN